MEERSRRKMDDVDEDDDATDTDSKKKFEKKGRRAKMQKKPHSGEVKGENKS